MFDRSSGWTAGGIDVGGGSGADIVALLAGCDVTDVAAVEDLASDRDVDEVDRFLSYDERDGELERSLAESFGVASARSSSSPPEA